MIATHTTQHEVSVQTGLQVRDEGCRQMVAEAERELGAFVSVVTEIFGSAAAARAAEDWVELAETVSLVAADGAQIWRKLTIMASCRLAANSIFGGQFTQNELAECHQGSSL